MTNKGWLSCSYAWQLDQLQTRTHDMRQCTRPAPDAVRDYEKPNTSGNGRNIEFPASTSCPFHPLFPLYCFLVCSGHRLFIMEYRGKYNPRILFPSFSLVVNRFILKRPAQDLRAYLRWINVPGACTKDSSVQKQREVDWAMVRSSLRCFLTKRLISFCSCRRRSIAGTSQETGIPMPVIWRAV